MCTFTLSRSRITVQCSNSLIVAIISALEWCEYPACHVIIQRISAGDLFSNTVYKGNLYAWLLRTTVCAKALHGDVLSVQEKHGPSHKLSDQEELIVLQLFLNKSGIYLRQELFDITGTWVSCATICRTAKVWTENEEYGYYEI